MHMHKRFVLMAQDSVLSRLLNPPFFKQKIPRFSRQEKEKKISHVLQNSRSLTTKLI